MKAAVISYSTGYFMVSCSHFSLVTKSLGQMSCMMLYCFFFLNNETLLQHGRCSPGRKFNLQHKNIQSTGNPSHFPWHISVPQHHRQSQYLLEHFPWSLILHLGFVQRKQEYSYWDKWKIRQLLRILFPAISGSQVKFTVHTYLFYKCVFTMAWLCWSHVALALHACFTSSIFYSR